MFSDILTPLPSMGIEFDVVKGSGPIIPTPIRSMDQVKALKKIDDPDKTVPFLRQTLEALRKETEGRSTLLGFIGSPFTLAAYSVEGKVISPRPTPSPSLIALLATRLLSRTFSSRLSMASPTRTR